MRTTGSSIRLRLSHPSATSWSLLQRSLALALACAAAACSEPDPDELDELSGAVAGEDGNDTVAGTGQVVNAYSALTANANAGDTAVTLSNIGELTTAALGPVAHGDLVLMIQTQGASIGTDNTAAGYGNVTSLGNAGRYELVFVDSVAGNTLTLAVPLRYSYSTSAGAQVVRVPQYRSLTVPAGTSLTATDWNGTRGGVVALYVRDGIALNGTIDVTGRGFRGGALDNSSNTGIAALYRSTAAGDGGEKGEGIAGTTTTYDSLGGRYGRGAPANGGGGGNAHNCGGGGGANGHSSAV